MNTIGLEVFPLFPSLNVFIGSSAKAIEEGDVEVAAALIRKAGLNPVPWNSAGAFPIGIDTWAALTEKARKGHFYAAAFIFREDDTLEDPMGKIVVTRDNVLLEYGLFSGALGPEKCAIFRCGKPRLPSDLKGITYLGLRPKAKKLQAAVNAWADALRDAPSGGQFILTDLHVKQLVKAMQATKVPLTDIYMLMERLGSPRLEVEAVMNRYRL